MKRYPYNYRHTAYNEGSFYTFVPLARKPVAPGERLSALNINLRILSAVFDKANVTPAMAQIWAFYIPHRLVWNQWIDFIALDPAVVNVPRSTTAFPELFEATASGAGNSVFARRSMKLTYNEYFGEESQAANGAWYADITNDTDVTIKRLLAWDQWTQATKSTGSYAQNTYVAPVAGASATISLDDFQRALEGARASRRQKVTGDKYVDTMRLFGVELDWRVQMAPEFLGSSQVILTPREKASSQAVDQGGANQLYKRASEYVGQLGFKLASPKAFAEHGLIMAFVGVRPAFMTAGSRATDAEMDLPVDFYRPETGGVVEYEGNRLRERHIPYLKGRNLIGVNSNSNIFVNTTAQYPPATDYTVMTGSGPSQLAFGAEINYKGVGPIRPQVA